MAESPTIETERMIIRNFTEAFLTLEYLGWLNDPEIMRYSEQRHRRHTVASCRAYMESFQNTPNYFWALLKKGEEPRHIGNLNAYVDVANQVADLGILIGAREAAGKGFGREAWIGVMDFLFAETGIRKISAGTLAGNLPMMRLARAAGMEEDGRRRKQYLVDGREMDIVYWSLLREAWSPTG